MTTRRSSHAAPFPDLFDTLVEDRATHGAVPVENALAGAVVDNLDLLANRPVSVVGEAYVRVELCLVTPPSTESSSIRSVASHPVALRQCHSFFERNPTFESVVAYDTAGSIRDLLNGDASYDAAIGPAFAAQLYGGKVVERGVEDHRRNFTRFLIVAAGDLKAGRPEATEEARSKTSVAFVLPHRPGALHEALGVLFAHGLDLTRLESRPIPGRPWEYRFYVDFRETGASDREAALENLEAISNHFTLFGSYPEVVIPDEEQPFD